MKPVKYLLLSLLGMSLHVSAQTVVDDAWVRATVAGQPSTGAFMHITSRTDSKLVEVRSPVARTVQIHESKMQNDVMSMQPVAAVALPAGVPYTAPLAAGAISLSCAKAAVVQSSSREKMNCFMPGNLA